MTVDLAPRKTSPALLTEAPATIGAVTPAWLQTCLRAVGSEAIVTGFTTKPVGAGMMGATYRLFLEFEGVPEGAPASLIFKTTGEGEISRRLGKRGYGLAGKPGFYAAETHFYADLATSLPILTPRCYAAWLSPEEDEFSLLLEDIHDARAGDELAGCTFEEAREAMVNIAGLHAPMWNSPVFDTRSWLSRPLPEWSAVLQSNMDRALLRFRERLAATVEPETIAIIEAFVPHYADWIQAVGRNMSLTHNDFRLDNMMFKHDGRCVTLDWQSMMTAHSGRDTGLFLGCSVPTGVRREHGTTLLQAYCDRMNALGVSYSMQDCVEDFRLGVFLGLSNVVIGMSAVSMTDRGDRMFRTKLARCIATIKDYGALDALSDLSAA